MSEAELWELFFQASDAVGMGATVFLTVVSAYLAAAYFVGARLGRYQVTFVSVLFVLFAAFAAFMTFFAFKRLFYFVGLLENRHGFVRYLPDGTPLLLMALDAILVVAALYFMYQIRRNPRLGALSR
jgi:hypothetical protein